MPSFHHVIDFIKIRNAVLFIMSIKLIRPKCSTHQNNSWCGGEWYAGCGGAWGGVRCSVSVMHVVVCCLVVGCSVFWCGVVGYGVFQSVIVCCRVLWCVVVSCGVFCCVMVLCGDHEHQL